MKITARTLYLALLLSTAPGLATASGFGLIESNANGQGSAYAGASAVADNASTIFFNPAGMTHLPGRQFTVSVHAIDFHAKFNDGNAATNDGGDAGDLSFVPNFYYAMPITANTWFGLGVNVPFGLKTEYDASWSYNTKGIKSDLKTININPSVATKLTDKLSLGFGLNAMYISADLTKSLTGSPSVTATIKGNDWGYGYNAGLLYEIDAGTRVGISYRSRVKQQLDGDAVFTALAPNGPVTADVTLPDTASLSVFKQVTPTVALLADVSWTGWSAFDQLQIVRTTGVPLETTYERWKNTYRFSVGAHYQLNDRIKLRTGIGFDQSPIPDAEHRTVRVPDSDRTWVAFGIGYRLSDADTIDAAYSHLFVKDAPINFTNEGTSTLINGTYKSHVDILGLQYTHNF